jgi:predicted dehydrogenase
MADVRLAVFGCGFWARFQLAAWREVGGVQIVALYNRTRQKAEGLAAEFGVPAVYGDPEELICREQPEVIDIITDISTHLPFVELAARSHIPVICQKPMAANFADAQKMVDVCASTHTPLVIHENWRWQTPIRQLKQELESGRIGRPFRARIQFSNSFPVFDNQPFLKELEQFILTDIGSHILDTARFLFGDAQRIYCQSTRVNPNIRGEDVATVMLQQGDLTCTCEMSYASRLEHERFPETFILVEGEGGSLELTHDYWLRCTTAQGTSARRWPPKHYPWADPSYDLVHSSIVPCNAHILAHLQSGQPAETRGEDNLKTMQLVFAAYQSASTGQAVLIN